MKTSRLVWRGVVVAIPLAGFLLLMAVPELDVRWEHQPSHFWLVLAAAGMNAALAYATGDAARRRGDARVFLVSLAFLASAGFLFLHALATPGVLLEGPNAGFVTATPVGLTVCAVLFAASSLRLEPGPATRVMRRLTHLRFTVLAVLAGWCVVSIAELPPLDGPPPLERGSVAMVALATVALACYVASALGYLRRYLQRRSRLLASIVVASVLLAQAMVAVAFSRSWHASWWEWHVLMLAAFGVVAWTARSQWQEEPFTDLYLEETVAGSREVTVIFADLEGFTAFSEHRDAREVAEMLNAFFEVAVPAVVEEHEGDVTQIIGDAIMVTFNARDDQPDHARRAVQASVELRDRAAALGRRHPGWPRLRIGVNTGEAVVGVLGAAGGRRYTAVGDPVNLAARLQQSAPIGEVVIGARTLAQVGGAQVEPLGALRVKGKRDAVEAYLLTAPPRTGAEEIPGLEAIVADAERLGFEMSSSAELGPMLRGLAASKPGGRLLELGTGVGVGTAWLLAGMDEDAHLTSVENDARVLEIAQRHLADDGRVAFRHEDGESFLDDAVGEAFDLVFADTWPGKFYGLDAALSLVAVGGVYLVDDLSPHPDWPREHAEKVESLVAELRGRAGFVAVEIAWSSGLMMLVRVSEAK